VAITTDSYNVIGRHYFLALNLEVKIVSMVSLHCHAHRLASAYYCTAADLSRWCVKLQKHFNAIMEVFYCFTVAIRLPGDASDYNENKTSAVAARMQNKMVVE